jgi:prepilin-type N-terminal cleavage/methylation domain-containing protein
MWCHDGCWLRIRGRGFTLLEVLVAMTILSVGIIGVIGAMSLSMTASSNAARIDEASRLAQNQLELGVSAPGDGLEAKTGTSGRFMWSLTYQEKPHGLCSATVVVEWMEYSQTQSYRLSQIFVPRRKEGKSESRAAKTGHCPLADKTSSCSASC